MPPRWVPKLTILPDQFDTRCPKGQKLIHYRQCTHEVFAKFGECSRWDGMVERLILFEDPQCQSVKQCMEFFARRKDRLRKRLSLPKEETIVEYFDPGASFGLKETKSVKGEKRVMYFYHTARLDGLVERKEVLGTKITETFQDRDDRLVYRLVSYAPKVETGDDSLESQPSDSRTAGLEGDVSEDVLPIRKATQKFGRNENVPAAMDVVKRTFFVSSNRIRVDFHYGEDSITANSRLYSRDGPPRSPKWTRCSPPPRRAHSWRNTRRSSWPRRSACSQSGTWSGRSRRSWGRGSARSSTSSCWCRTTTWCATPRRRTTRRRSRSKLSSMTT